MSFTNKAIDQGSSAQETVSLSQLSDLCGFPVDFIKRELLLDVSLDESDQISMEKVRLIAAEYLNRTMIQ